MGRRNKASVSALSAIASSTPVFSGGLSHLVGRAWPRSRRGGRRGARRILISSSMDLSQLLIRFKSRLPAVSRMAPDMVFCGTMLLVLPFCYLINVSPFLNPTPTGINAEELQPLALFMLVVLWFGLLLLQFSVGIPGRRGPNAWRAR